MTNLRHPREGIAIIGVGCRLPGAPNIAALWRLLCEQREAIGEYPGGRFPEMDALYQEASGRNEKIPTHLGGFLPDVDRFDAPFFELAPREAMYLDPQHRLLLEVAWEALEDAGQVKQVMHGTKTGVFVGVWADDFTNYLRAAVPDLEFYALSGGGHAGAAGRLSFAFGLEGPSTTVDTVCSSSLVAIHLACQSLLTGESEMALAGSVNLIFDIDTTNQFAHAGMLSSDGRCKFASASGDGFVRSEGAGVIVLKRLTDAIAAGDPIHAVIRGSAVNNDGRTNGLMMTPSVEGQKRMLRDAWANAGIDPRHLCYIEAHGTGTKAGDPVEIEALGSVLAEAGATSRCALGSIKTNIGHTESAAGMAGLIKTVLALKHGVVPPSLHGETLNSAVDWDRLPVRVLTESLELPQDGSPVLAGVNSFGLTGTNAHVVLEKWQHTSAISTHEAGPFLLTISAHTREALNARLQALFDDLQNEDKAVSLPDLCYTANARRTHHAFRAGLVAADKQDLESKLLAAIHAEDSSDIVLGLASQNRHRVVFVAPGQGSQWTGMARELFALEPAFRNAFEAADVAIAAETGWSLISRILGDDAAASLKEIDVIQPALFAMSFALSALWQARGVTPDAVVGHSMGEVAAACIAGALSLPDAAAVICRRSRLMKKIRGSGGMASVELPLKEIEPLLRRTNGAVSVAASNSPNTTIISGDSSAIDDLLTELNARQIFSRRINVDVASHSAQVDPILDQLTEELYTVLPTEATVPILSTVTGDYLSGHEMTAAYWVQNLRRSVLFNQAVSALASDGHNIFIELSPHPILLSSMETTLGEHRSEALVIASMRREQPERASMLNALARLYCAGYPVNWNLLYPEGGNCIALPVYPFQRERCWPEVDTSSNRRYTAAFYANPLLRRRFDSSIDPGVVLWEVETNLTALPFLNDHRVLGSVVLPATAQLEMVLEAIQVEKPDTAFDIADVAFINAAYLDNRDNREFQLSLIPDGSGQYRFELRSRSSLENLAWTLHSTGLLIQCPEDSAPEAIELAALRNETSTHLPHDRHYRKMSLSGLEYGPSFQLCEEVWLNNGKALSRVREAGEEKAQFLLHPAMLDACLQSALHLRPGGNAFSPDDTYLPVGLERMQVYKSLPTDREILAHSWITHTNNAKGSFKAQLRVLDTNGEIIADIKGIEVRRVTNRNAKNHSDFLYQIEWMEIADLKPSLGNHATLDTHYLIFADEQDVAAQLRTKLETHGGRCTLIRKSDITAPDNAGELERVLAEVATRTGPPSAVIDLWSLDGASPEDPTLQSILIGQSTSSYHIAALVQAIGKVNLPRSPRLWIITNGVIAIDEVKALPNLPASPVWGLGPVVAWEHPELRSVIVDLGRIIQGHEIDTLAHSILTDERNERLALRGAKKYAARFANSTLGKIEVAPRILEEHEDYQFEISEPGVLDNLALRAIKRRTPGPGEVAIDVVAAGLNFTDTAKAMGIYPGLDPNAPVRMGGECAGRVASIGEGVTGLQIGDEVVAGNPNAASVGLLASHVIVPYQLVCRKPEKINFEEAATFSLVFATAYHALVELARIRAGEWVLIHAASGGLGLAAIQIAQLAGANIIATASSDEKQAYLRSLGVKHVLQSRTLDFAAETMRITHGRGVDIVLNSTSGEWMRKSLETLAPHGRFIELGKRDIYEDARIGLKCFSKNLSYCAVDMAAMWEEQPAYSMEIWQTIMNKIESGEWKPLPVQTFSSSEPGAPFRWMAQAKHIGKIAVRMDRNVHVLPANDRPLFSHDATYIITGGMGGVGSLVAEWMAENGAGNIVLVSRRSSSGETAEILQRVEKHGARAVHAQVDICDAAQVFALIEGTRKTMPPLKGIMHAAVIIDDSLVSNLTPERFTPVYGPKITGTWNLHQATLNDSLDFFVFFSSIAAVYPQPGHGSYAAANAFMDTFAHYRRALGLPAISVNWGGWENIGLVREKGTTRSMDGYSSQGMLAFSGEEALAALREALETNPVQTTAVGFDLEKLRAFHTQNGIPPIFNKLVSEQPASEEHAQSEVRLSLQQAASTQEREKILVQYLQRELGRVLKLPIERIEPDRVLGTMGLDSLMALEFVRRVNAGLAVGLPVASVFNYPRLRELANLLDTLLWTTQDEVAVDSNSRDEIQI